MKIGSFEIRFTECDAAQIYFEVFVMRVRPPRIPHLDTLLQNSKVLRIGHTRYSTAPKDVAAPVWAWTKPLLGEVTPISDLTEQHCPEVPMGEVRHC